MTSLEALPSQSTKRHTAALPAVDTRWAISVSRDVEQLSRAWLSLEMQGISTPYQTLGWQRAALSTFHATDDACLITLRDSRGQTVALLPLVIRMRGGIRAAMFAGGKHANYAMGLFTPECAAALDPDALAAALKNAANQAGIDLYDLRNQPTHWRDTVNPFSRLPHQAAASSAWRADLQADGEEFIKSLMSSESRKKLRHKERRLGELGTISYAEAVTSLEARGVLNAFLSQKSARFAALGIRNPFDDPAALAFLDKACVQSLQEGPPAPVSLFAMSAGERILAVFGGVIHAGRFSGMFTSFDPDPEVARFSPGDLLLLNLVKTMCNRGLTAFDLGTGDAGYKTSYCAIAEPLFDSFLPMTLKGKLAATALSFGHRAKAGLKRHQGLLQPLRTLFKR